jgi:integrase
MIIASSFQTSRVMTLADVAAAIGLKDEFSPQSIRDMVSAINTFARACNTAPNRIVADVRSLRERFAGLSAAVAGVSPGRWANVRSLVLAALQGVGIRARAGRYRSALFPEWETLLATISDRHHRSALSRFAHFCNETALMPESVTAGTFEQFRATIEQEELLRDPGEHYRATAQRWNEAVNTVAGWPQLVVSIPSRSRQYALPWSAFPASFEADVRQYQIIRDEFEPFSPDYCAPKSPVTLKNERRQILAVASAMVHAGISADAITGLASLTEVQHARAGLQWIYERFDRKLTSETANMARLLKVIAKHHVKAAPDHLAQLGRLAKNLSPGARGFTKKNRAFLQQFADRRVIGRLLNMPYRLIDDLCRSDTGLRRSAVVAEFAVATAILAVLPLRVNNLTGLEIDRHLRWHGNHVLVSIPADATKNRQPIEAELPDEVVDLIAIYLDRFRPRLAEAGCPWLFPGENSAKRPPGSFGSQLGCFLLKHAGVKATPHQFRHLAAKLFLDEHPHGFATVQQLLGHKDEATTRRFYADLSSIVATKRYSELIVGLMDELTDAP